MIMPASFPRARKSCRPNERIPDSPAGFRDDVEKCANTKTLRGTGVPEALRRIHLSPPGEGRRGQPAGWPFVFNVYQPSRCPRAAIFWSDPPLPEASAP